MSYIKQHSDASRLAWFRIRQAPLINFMSLLLIITALTLPSFLMVVVKNLQDIFSQWQTGTQMTLYLQQDAPKVKIEELIKHLESQPDIAHVKYISSDQGLKEFSQQFHLDLIDQIKNNPLPAVIIVQPKISKTNANTQLAERLKNFPLVKTVQFDLQWLKRLHGIIQVSNAVHTATQRYHKEIRINQLVGATNAYIRRPFLYGAAFVGITAGIVTWICISMLIQWLNPKVTYVAELYGSNLHLKGFTLNQVMVLLLTSIGLSWAGAMIACDRFVKNDAKSTT
jgi:cell division transport system permease protein